METKRARGKCIANALVCQLCWTFLFCLGFLTNRWQIQRKCDHNYRYVNKWNPVWRLMLQTLAVLTASVWRMIRMIWIATTNARDQCSRLSGSMTIDERQKYHFKRSGTLRFLWRTHPRESSRVVTREKKNSQIIVRSANVTYSHADTEVTKSLLPVERLVISDPIDNQSCLALFCIRVIDVEWAIRPPVRSNGRSSILHVMFLFFNA